MARSANLKWLVKINSTPATTATYVEVGGLESLAWGNSEEVQEGFFISDDGAGYSDVTGGRLNITLSGKRVDGDTGQDYIIGLMGSWGSSRKSTLQLTHVVTGDVYLIPCSIEITAPSGGDTVALESFECVCHSDGAWTFTASA